MGAEVVNSTVGTKAVTATAVTKASSSRRVSRFSAALLAFASRHNWHGDFFVVADLLTLGGDVIDVADLLTLGGDFIAVDVCRGYTGFL